MDIAENGSEISFSGHNAVMHRLVIIGAFVASLAVTGPATPAGSKASVGLTDRTPVRIAGYGFRPHERVSVRVAPTSRAAYAKVVTATASGRIVVIFPNRVLPECVGYRLTATGNHGSRATGREVPPPCGIVVSP